MESVGLSQFMSDENTDYEPAASRARRPTKKKQAPSRRAAAPPPRQSRKRTWEQLFSGCSYCSREEQLLLISLDRQLLPALALTFAQAPVPLPLPFDASTR